MMKLEKVPLEYFHPMIARSNLAVKGGVLWLDGELEYAPHFQLVHLTDLTLRDLKLDYIHTAETAGAETARKQQVARAAKEQTDRSDRVMKLDRLVIDNSEIGLVNKGKPPGYRVFVSDLHLELTNLSNHFVEGPAKATARGLFMGKGKATATATFRPEANGPDFDLKVAIEDTPLVTMNDLLRSYGKFDVTAGIFSFFTELSVRNNHIEGYVKPLFRDMQVYDKRQDAEKSLFRKIYEKLVGGVSKLLENSPATRSRRRRTSPGRWRIRTRARGRSSAVSCRTRSSARSSRGSTSSSPGPPRTRNRDRWRRRRRNILVLANMSRARRRGTFLAHGGTDLVSREMDGSIRGRFREGS